jgi:putative flippase GtrA
MNPLHRQTFAQIVRFGIVGVTCTLIHYGVYWLLHTLLGANPAYIVGYLTSFVLNFYLTAYFTFRTQPSWHKLIGMAGAHGINFLLHLSLLNLFLAMGIPETIAPIPVFAIVIPINFLLVRFVFKRK